MTIQGRLKRLYRLCKDILFPIFCIGCNEEGEWLCSNCFPSIDLIGIFDEKVTSVLPYDTMYMEELLHNYKYGFVEDVKDVIEHLLMFFFLLYPNVFDNFDAIVYVPLYKKRFVERGFNQSQCIADVVSACTGVSVEVLLKRDVDTPHQARLGRKERFANVEGVFSICGDITDFNNKSILLVDDVFTTGATMQSCCDVLLSSGVGSVECFTLFRGVNKKLAL